MKIKKECQHCGKHFLGDEHRKYCSRECYHASRRGKHPEYRNSPQLNKLFFLASIRTDREKNTVDIDIEVNQEDKDLSHLPEWVQQFLKKND